VIVGGYGTDGVGGRGIDIQLRWMWVVFCYVQGSRITKHLSQAIGHLENVQTVVSELRNLGFQKDKVHTKK